MKVLIGNSIIFDQDSEGYEFALICGPYRIEEMTDEEFFKWEEDTTEDYITEDYEGGVRISKNWKDIL